MGQKEANDAPPTSERRSPRGNVAIFRPEALREYKQRRVEPPSPEYVSPRALAPLWLLIALLAFGAAVVGVNLARMLPARASFFGG